MSKYKKPCSRFGLPRCSGAFLRVLAVVCLFSIFDGRTAHAQIDFNLDLGSFTGSSQGADGHMPEVSDPSDVTISESTCGQGTTYFPTNLIFCDMVGQTSLITDTMIYDNFESGIKKVARHWETFLYGSIDTLVYSSLQSIHTTEKKMIEWWTTMWHHNMRPGMQAATEQQGVATAQQTLDIIKVQDAGQANETAAEIQETEAENAVDLGPDESGCVTATVSGGLGRAQQISKGMQKALQNRALAAGTNKRGTPGALGKWEYNKQRIANYENIFCDPASNGGNANCASGVPDPNPLANADTQFTKTVTNQLTIPVNSTADVGGTMTEGEAMQAAVEMGIDNLIGPTGADPVPESIATKTGAQEMLMARRAFLARNAAARSIPDFIAGQRMPGSKMGKWVREIRQASGVPAGKLSSNPSYREVIHAITIDRFNSGTYAFGSITDRNKVEMEKLRLSAFYLIMLRDYYELLERTALTLAVQVAVMTDEIKLSDPNEKRPTRK